jgi:hypothetical protein
MRRIAIAITGLTMAALAASSASADYSSDLQNYSVLREDLKECTMDTNWHQLSSEAREDCNDYFRHYVLFTTAEDPSVLYIHCRSSATCIATPDGFPSAAAAIPQGSTVYDEQPRATTTKKAKKSRSKASRRHGHR